MTKTFCDRCGKEINRIVEININARGYVRENDGFGDQLYEYEVELCRDCAAEILSLLHNTKIVPAE